MSVIFTYSFPNATIIQALGDQLYGGHNTTGPMTQGFNPDLQSLASSTQYSANSALTSAFNMWSNVADISFQQGSSANNISFAYWDAPQRGSGTTYGVGSPVAGAGENPALLDATSFYIFLNQNSIFNGMMNQPTFNNWGIWTLAHEIGHVFFGAGHPDNGLPTDDLRFSIMKYPNNTNQIPDSNVLIPLTPGMADIYNAQQYAIAHGADLDTMGGSKAQDGNTTYTFTGTTVNLGHGAINIEPGNAVMTIWDRPTTADENGKIDSAGGIDSIDASGMSTNVYITLEAGKFSSIGSGINTASTDGVGGVEYNVGIAINAQIENARGGSGADYLKGNDLANILEGNAGNDTLEGGKGNDVLKGGLGNDTYKFDSTSGIDTLEDSDGSGLVKVNEQTLSGGAYKFESIYKNDSTGYQYIKVNDGADLLVLKENNPNRIIIKNWSDNNLGIRLTGEAPDVPQAGITGDYKKKTYTPEGADYELYKFDDNGNYQKDGPEANAPDLLQGTNDKDVIDGGGGSDILSGYGGDDYIMGKDGGDLIHGGTGKDTLIGGDGADIIYGSSTAGPVYENNPNFEMPEFSSPNITATGFNWYAGYSTTYANGAPKGLLSENTARNRVGGDDGNIIDGGIGNDFIAAGTGADYVHGGEDNDVIFGMDQADILFGDTGNDVIYGDGRLRDDNGNISLIYSFEDGNDVIDGGAGEDILIGGGADDIIFGGENDDEIWGDNNDQLWEVGNDHLFGGNGADTINGGFGNDYLDGGGNDGSADTLSGDAGDDTLIGGGGDTLKGGAGKDTFYAKAGDNIADQDSEDRVFTSENLDTTGGAPNVSLNANSSSQTINVALAGGLALQLLDGIVANGDATYTFGDTTIKQSELIGNNLQAALTFSSNAQHLFGGKLDDYIEATGTANSTLFGGLGNDTLIGNDGNNTLNAGFGNDTLYGGTGNDLLDGGAGADTMAGGLGDDTYQIDDNADQITEALDEGTDTVNSSITYTLINNLEHLTLTGTTNIHGTGNELDNLLRGNAAANTLNGGSGNDTLKGVAGNDILNGGTNDDLLQGGDGNDTYQLNLGDGADVIDDIAGINTITFGAGITQASLQLSQYQGSDGSYYLRLSYGDQGDTVVIKNGLSGSIQQYQFTDGSTISHTDLIGTAGIPLYLEGTVNADTFYGSNLADIFDAGDGNDTLNGEGGDDIINGDAGNDVINGGTGSDTIDGGTGNDTLDGNAGQDSYVMRWGMGQDHLLDSADGEMDTIALEAGINLLDLTSKRIGDDLLIHFNASDDGYLINNYYAGNQQWQLRDAQGTVTAIADFIAINDSSTELEKVLNSYQASVKSTYFANLGAQGYRPSADGSLYKNETISSPDRVTSTRHRAFYNVTTQNSDDAYIQRQSQGYTSIQSVLSVNYTTSTTYTAAASANLFDIPGARFLRYDTPRQFAGGTNGPLGIPDGYKIYSSYASGQAITSEGIWIVPESYTPALVPVSNVVFTNTNLAENNTLTLENIIAGSSNNNIDAYSIAYVDGTYIYGSATIDAGAGDDQIMGSGFLYGNDGNDTIEGNGILIGGNGNDSLNGYGSSDRYIIFADDVGVDTIVASWHMQGIHYETEKSAYDFWYYTSLGYSEEEIYSLPSPPYIAPNDYAALAPLYAAGIIEKDTVEFGVGINLSNLEVLYENIGNYQGGQTLIINWGLNKGIRIELPYDQPNYTYDENGNPQIDWGASSTWGLGRGIEQFKFADGTIVSIAEILAIAEEVVVETPNYAPEVIAEPDTLYVGDDSAINWTLPVTTLFYDGDLNDTLTYSITNIDGSVLPSWLSFDPETLTLSGLPNSELIGDYAFLITATDSKGLTASVNFALNVSTLPGELIEGTLFDDVLNGTSRDDTIFGNEGSDTISAGSGNDLVFGGTGDDIVNGGLGRDEIYGDDGIDHITGGLGDDNISGEAGQDTYYFNLGDGVDTIYDISEFADFTKVVFGAGITQQDITYSYLDGNFEIFVGENGDQIAINGFSPEDLVNGLSKVELTFTEDNSVIDLIDALAQNEVIILGSEFSDVITSALPTEIIIANGGDDTINASIGSGYIAGGGGNDNITVATTAGYAFISGDDGEDNITANTAFSVYLNGGEGNDILTAGSGDDGLEGGAGNDTLNGGAGNDYFIGDLGDDTLIGGTGDDTYYFNLGYGHELIDNAAADNITATDTLFLGDVLPEGVVLSQVANDLVVTISETDSVTIKDYYADLDNKIDQIRFSAYDAVNETYIDVTWDSTTFEALVVPSNRAPEVLSSISALAAIDGSALSYVLSVATLFTDADQGDILTYTVTLVDGNPLPSWLSYDSATSTLTGTPGPTHIGSLALNVTATDLAGETANIDFELTVAAMPDQELIGTASNDNLVGGSGNDTLDGLAGTDTMAGGYGNDTYFVERTTDKVIELANQGIDTINTTVTYTASANVENLTLLGTASITANGNELNNVLTGNTGNNTLDGKAGADNMLGGLGNDTYVVDDEGDVVTELENEGADTVRSSKDYTLGDNIERLTLTGTTAINATGNMLNNILTGNDIDNQLVGGDGNDNLNGGLGADTLIGGLGNDTYVVENALDVVIEQIGEGTDVVQASVNYTLAAEVESLTLTGTVAINGTGNELNNTLTGNAADNQLAGGSGNDNLNGGLGADTMLGGLGNDIYTVDNVNDVVTELADEGTDRVNSSIDYTLGDEVENLTLTGSVAINATGNALNNTLSGNAADNVLSGGAGNDILNGGVGADTMLGGLDNDTYTVDDVNDVVTELVGEGTDRVNSGISYTLGDNLENLTLTGAMDIMGFGNNLANVLAGNTGNNYLYGLAANDTITGNNGYDILQGGDDNDTISGNAGNSLLDGGSGNDRLTGGIENDLIIGGLGNDTITTGTGFDVIVFNKGDGADIVSASTGADNTLSLGGNFAYSDLSLTKTGNNLILKMGVTDQITFSNWYLTSPTNKSVVNLQVIAEAIQGFALGGADDLRNNSIENFNFTNLVAAFDSSGAIANWQLTDALLTAHLQAGSDSAAMGGDLAYQYGKNSSLTGMGLANAQNVISAASFGQSAQALNNPSVWQAELVKLG